MIRLQLRLAILFAAITLPTPFALGQVVTGVPPFSSFAGSTFDQVNVGNLNAMFEIPMVNKAGRGGMTFTAALIYNSSMWTPDNGGWGDYSWAPSANWGWNVASSANPGSVAYDSGMGYCTDDDGDELGYWYLTLYTYTDSLGTPHPIGTAGTGLTLSDQPPDCYPANPSSATQTLADGSGIVFSYDYDAGSGYIYDRSGVNVEWEPGIIVQYTTDPNGNSQQMSVSGSTTSFTDSLGATALTASGSGTPSSPITYQYTGPDNHAYTYTVNYTAMTVRTNFGCGGIAEYGPSAQNLVSSIDLPDGTSYSFTYEPTPGYSGDTTARLASVTLPSGGTISYKYVGGSQGITCADGTTATLQRSTPDTGSSYWQYAHTETSSTSWTTTITDPTSAANQTLISFEANNYGSPLETQRKVYEGSTTSGTLIDQVDTCYGPNPTIPCPTTAISFPVYWQTVQNTLPGVSPSKTMTIYSAYGLPTEIQEYGFGGSLARTTVTNYDTALDGAYQQINDRPTSVVVCNAGGSVAACGYVGAVAAETTYTYDSYGNMTGKTLYTNSTPSTVSRSFTYGSYGVLASSTDYNGNTTNYSSLACDSAFPQTISLPDGTSKSINWNCYVALPNSTTDVNGNATNYSYDEMVRPTQTTFPDGGWKLVKYTSGTQRDTYTGTTSSSPSSSCTGCRHEQIDLDGLGRLSTHELVNDSPSATYINYAYDQVGRLDSVTNPYRSTSDSTYGTTSYAYDPLNRLTKTTNPDGSYVQNTFGTATQSCSASTYGYGYSTLYPDESGNNRQMFTDALGRVIEADEPTQTSNSLSPYTCYQYDALDDLTVVNQGSETRNFGYDYLGRLTQATVPEAGGNTKYYYYSTSGGAACSGDPTEVCRRTDERGITTTYSYDSMNLLGNNSSAPAMSYSNGDASVYYYHNQTSYNGLSTGNGNGARTGMSDGSGQTARSFDSMGRVLAEERTIGSVTKSLSYTYNYDGSLASVTYPSGRTVAYSPSAIGRPVSAVDSADSINYVTAATYWPQGALESAQYGSSVTYSTQYNHRLFPVGLQGQTSLATFFELQPSFNPNGTVSGVANAITSGRTQTFGYDYLNRITSAQTTAASGSYCWGQAIPTNGYDRYGNLLTINSTQCSAPTISLSVNTAGYYNQVTNTGYSYDASGNMTHDASYNYTWNAEGKETSVAGSYTYAYDGDGRRVENSFNDYYYWFSPDGLPLAETNTSGTTQNEYIYFNGARVARHDSTTNVYYYFSDQIHSAQTITNSSGTVCYDSDFTPFGYEMAYTTSCPQDYKFAAMERDGFTGNDPTWFRNYEENLGRWMSPDPAALAAANPANPQTWNQYSYVLNDPTTLSDPFGLFESTYEQNGGGCGGDGGGGGGGHRSNAELLNDSKKRIIADLQKKNCAQDFKNVDKTEAVLQEMQFVDLGLPSNGWATFGVENPAGWSWLKGTKVGLNSALNWTDPTIQPTKEGGTTDLLYDEQLSLNRNTLGTVVVPLPLFS